MAHPKKILTYKTIILSDVHLGTKDCKIDEVNFFLKHTRCDRLILNGDIIDGWSLKRKGGWTKGHTNFIRKVLKKAEKKNTEVIYLAGNHDELMRKFLPIFLDKIRMVENYVLPTKKGNYLVLHGDVFDTVTMNNRWLSIIGDVGYQNLLRLNRYYNKLRSLRGKEYFSLSAAIKKKVKSAVNHLSNFENHLQNLAEKNGYAGVICGHIHTAEDKMIGNTHYLNSGDWVESLTAIVQHEDDRFEIITYDEFCRRLADETRQNVEFVQEDWDQEFEKAEAVARARVISKEELESLSKSFIAQRGA